MNMKQFAAISAINARVLALDAEVTAFRTKNVARQNAGEAFAYDEDNFHALAHNMRAFARELDEIAEAPDDDSDDTSPRGRPHIEAVHDGQEYEIEVICDCGCRESVPFARPDCSGECGLYMRPTKVSTYEEVAGLPPRGTDA